MSLYDIEDFDAYRASFTKKEKRLLKKICKRCKKRNRKECYTECIKDDAYIGLCAENDDVEIIETYREKKLKRRKR